MQPFIQIGNFRISLHILPENILLGFNIGFSVDEENNFHKSLVIGAIFVAISFIVFDEETY